MKWPQTFDEILTTDSYGNSYLKFWKCFFSEIAMKEIRDNCSLPPFNSGMGASRKVICSDSQVFPLGIDEFPLNEGRDISHLKLIHSFILRHLGKSEVFPEDLVYAIFLAEKELNNWLWENRRSHLSANESFKEKTPQFIIKDANKWIENSGNNTPKPLWKSLWFEREICALFAESNVGKSIYAVQMACEIARDKKVLYIDYEMDEPIFRARYSDHNGRQFSFPDNFFRAPLNPDDFSSKKLSASLFKNLDTLIENNHFQVLFIDNLTFLTEGDNSGIRSTPGTESLR